MDALANTEKIVALIGALIVGTFAIIALRNDWKKTGLDDQVTKILLGLMHSAACWCYSPPSASSGPRGSTCTTSRMRAASRFRPAFRASSWSPALSESS